ncbi:MAG: NAD-dependent protein deacylase [Muribaculaceae bacterium]|nr:NAD-dependent protein deacylase [Muribaculaceae bacterium]
MRQNIVVFTGAGISKESGLSTFRDSDGLWALYDPDIVATPQGFESDTKTALEFYNEMRLAVATANPNHAHIALALLEEVHDVTIITQNIDDLHERAGSSKVIHLHGDIRKVTSSKNRLDENCIKNLNLTTPIKPGDRAADGSQLRPYVVMFGEYLTKMSESTKLIKEADIFIVVGTSLRVFPANQLVNAAHHEIPRYLIDPGDIEKLPKGYIHIQQPASKGIDTVIRCINNLKLPQN